MTDGLDFDEKIRLTIAQAEAYLVEMESKPKLGAECERALGNRLIQLLRLLRTAADSTIAGAIRGDPDDTHIFRDLDVLDMLTKNAISCPRSYSAIKLLWDAIEPPSDGSILARAKQWGFLVCMSDLEFENFISEAQSHGSQDWLSRNDIRQTIIENQNFATLAISIALDWWNQRKAAEEKPDAVAPATFQALKDPAKVAANVSTQDAESEVDNSMAQDEVETSNDTPESENNGEAEIPSSLKNETRKTRVLNALELRAKVHPDESIRKRCDAISEELMPKDPSLTPGAIRSIFYQNH